MNSIDPSSDSYAQSAAKLKLVDAELERIRLSEQKVVTLMQQYDNEIDKANVDIKETKRQMQLVDNTLAHLKTSSVRDLEYSMKVLNQEMRGLDRGSEAFKQMQMQAKQLKQSWRLFVLKDRLNNHGLVGLLTGSTACRVSYWES